MCSFVSLVERCGGATAGTGPMIAALRAVIRHRKVGRPKPTSRQRGPDPVMTRYEMAIHVLRCKHNTPTQHDFDEPL